MTTTTQPVEPATHRAMFERVVTEWKATHGESAKEEMFNALHWLLSEIVGMRGPTATFDWRDWTDGEVTRKEPSLTCPHCGEVFAHHVIGPEFTERVVDFPAHSVMTIREDDVQMWNDDDHSEYGDTVGYECGACGYLFDLPNGFSREYV